MSNLSASPTFNALPTQEDFRNLGSTIPKFRKPGREIAR